MSRNEKTTKKARKARNKAEKERILSLKNDRTTTPWSGGFTVRARGWLPGMEHRFEWSGVQVPVDLTDKDPMDGVVAITEMVRNPSPDTEVN